MDDPPRLDAQPTIVAHAMDGVPGTRNEKVVPHHFPA
jgi:hypothetical protein